MKSPFFWSASSHRTSALMFCVGLTLSSACHKPRFQSAPADERTVETSEAGAPSCRRSDCNAADTASATTNDLQSVISAPEATSEAEVSDAAAAVDSSTTDQTQTEADVGTSTAPSGGSTTGLTTISSTDTSSHSLDSTTSPTSDSTASTTLEATSTGANSGSTDESSHSPIVSSDQDAGASSPDSGDASPIVLADAGPSDASLDAAPQDAALDGPDAALDAALVGDANTGFDAAEAEAPPLTCDATTLLPGVVRDFDEEHPDMEPCDDDGVNCASERGLVAPLLGDDNKPVFVADARDDDSTIQSEETFNQWFRDVEDVNVAIPFDLQLTTRPRMVVFDSDNPPAGSPSGFFGRSPGLFPNRRLERNRTPAQLQLHLRSERLHRVPVGR